MLNFEIDLPPTTVIIPTLNEAAHISLTVQQILNGAPACLLEVIIVDGGSKDGTIEIVSNLACEDSRVKLVHNPLRIQSSGINTAVLQANPRSEIIVRVDAHSKYEDNFIKDVVSEIVFRQTDSIVVRLQTVGVGCFQKAVAAVSNSLSGTGGSRHRMGVTSGYVDHGHHAAIRRTKFVELGGYDEAFAANEDAEFDYRLNKSGGNIWFAANIIILYYPRSNANSLAKQYFRYGWGRCQNFLKHQQRLRLRQMLPPLLVMYLIVFAIGFAILPYPLKYLISFPLVIYVITLGAGLIDVYRHNPSKCSLGAFFVLPIMHFSWGVGFIFKKISHKIKIYR